MNRIKRDIATSSLGRKALGPHPGLAIVSFWQGIVEIVLRVTALVASTAALIAAIIALVKAIQLPDSVSTTDVVRNSVVASGLVIAVACVGVLVEAGVLLVRFLNLGLLSIKISIFLIMDIVASAVVAVGFTGVGIFAAFVASDWSDMLLSDNQTILRNSLAAAAAGSFLAVLVLAILGVWILLHMVFKWNRKIVKYTIKDALHL